MKTITSLALIPLMALPVACTQIVATHGESTLKMNNFAGHTKAGMVQVGGKDGITINDWDDDATQVASAFIGEVGRAWRNYMILKGIEYIGDKYYINKNQELNAKSVENLEKLRNAKSAADQSHALEVLKHTPIETVPLASVPLT